MSTTASNKKWYKATGTKPEVNKVVFYRRKDDDKERLGLWDGNDWYIFDLQKGEWMKHYEFFAWIANHETPAPISDFEWSNVPKDAYKYVAFYAIAEARRNRINSGLNMIF